MTDSNNDAPAARGPPLGDRARRSEARESSRVWCPADFPALSSFTCCLVSLWSEFSEAYTVFDQHCPAQLLCIHQVWESLLTIFPLKYKRMQTVLLAREIGRLMSRDVNPL